MAKQTMDPREARFLASQAERLAGNKKQQNSTLHTGDDAPELVNDDNSNDNTGVGSKEQSHQFYANFRKICSEFQSQIDTLLLMSASSNQTLNSDAASNNVSNHDDAKAYYATAARRNEGRIKLDATLQNVRSLQRHALSSSSSVLASSNNIGNNDNNELLQSILQSPMPNVTQTDMRLLSQEIDKILKRVDEASEIICPKEKFVFGRYRKAMEEMERLGGSVHCSTVIADTKEGNNFDAEKEDDAKDQHDNLRSKYGGVLDNMSNCTIEISSDGTMLVNETTEDQLQYYSAPRPFYAMHPPSHTANEDQPHQHTTTNESSSYLLQNLQNVTLLIHGSRPSLHLQHIHNCRIYVSEPTLGAVHVTDCHSSEIRCSCYQLRVHDSKDVKFDVWVRSGPIIEDSRGIVFEGNYFTGIMKNDGPNNDSGNGIVLGRNMFWDVKDFNWLRALRKSPNFVVLAKTDGGNDKEVSKEESLAKNGIVPKESCIEPAVSPEEDSEDEL